VNFRGNLHLSSCKYSTTPRAQCLDWSTDDSIWDQSSLPSSNFSTFDVLHNVRLRAASSDLERIATLAYFLVGGSEQQVPIYIVGEDPEAAWSRQIQLMTPSVRQSLYFLSPHPENRLNGPAPTWNEIKEAYIPVDEYSLNDYRDLKDTLSGYLIRNCMVKGLSHTQNPPISRKGIILLLGHQFSVQSRSMQSIQDGTYTALVLPFSKSDDAIWFIVIGDLLPKRTFKRISILEFGGYRRWRELAIGKPPRVKKYKIIA
jgi:hypothetical protein